ncbi:UNVERIFIED_CONTAM: hypothetical protein Sradi_0976600 [Sesamum radiatum]|uniref:GAG-pre-integrase domain-containing protein n=1 Tax=Sesamum radiatum TaxID=300843 RepID=A0AAW2V5S5_SESRA
MMPTPQCTCGGCTCGASKTTADQAVFNRLIQFLMGLSESFDHLRDQLLVMDPVPTINKAYSMVLRVEKQREVHMEGSENMDTAALQVRAPGKKDYLAKGGNQRRTYVDKRGQYCTNCDKSGHTKDTCFKLHGTPDWYKELIEKKRREGGPMRGYNAEATETHNVQHQGTDNLLQELIRLMKGEGGQGKQIQNDPLHGNFAQMDDFAGKNCAFTSLSNNVLDSWIVDTGATNHMCAHKHNLQHTSIPSHAISVHLPDGNTQSITHIGSVTLDKTLTLTDVLYIPNFKFNLLSVSKLCSNSSIEVLFHSTCCLLQDQATKRVIAVGKLQRNLYVLDSSSFDPATITSHTSLQSAACLHSSSCNNVLWHRRLGHPSMSVLKHTPIPNSSSTIADCMICPMAKQTRLPFATSSIQSKDVFELVHVDLWGPINSLLLVDAITFLQLSMILVEQLGHFY